MSTKKTSNSTPKPPSEKRKKYLISLPENTMLKARIFALKSGIKTSKFFEFLVEEVLADIEIPQQLVEVISERAKAKIQCLNSKVSQVEIEKHQPVKIPDLTENDVENWNKLFDEEA
jgi:hypothetical protein